MDEIREPSENEKTVIALSGNLIPISEIAAVTKLALPTIYSIRSRYKTEIRALSVEARKHLVDSMSEDLKQTGATLAAKFKNRAELLDPDAPMDDKTALSVLRLAANHNLERPTQKTEHTEVRISLEVQQRMARADREIAKDWKSPEGAIEVVNEEVP